jgi:CRP-like cAMP-binding protein
MTVRRPWNQDTTVSSSLHSLEPCARIARNEGCGVERCGLCEARTVSICDAIAESELTELARATTVVELAPGEVFRHEGDPPDYLFNITSGAVKLFKLLPDGRRQIVGFLSVGDFVGFGRADAAAASAEATCAPLSVRTRPVSCPAGRVPGP